MLPQCVHALPVVAPARRAFATVRKPFPVVSAVKHIGSPPPTSRRRLNQLDFVTIRRVDKRKHRPARCLVRSIAKRISQSSRMFGKGFHILHPKGQMSEIRTNHDRTTSVIFTDFDQRLAAGRFQKNELRPAVTFLAADLFESENLAVEVECFFKIGDTVARVKKFGDHGQ